MHTEHITGICIGRLGKIVQIIVILRRQFLVPDRINLILQPKKQIKQSTRNQQQVPIEEIFFGVWERIWRITTEMAYRLVKSSLQNIEFKNKIHKVLKYYMPALILIESASSFPKFTFNIRNTKLIIVRALFRINKS